MARKKKKKRRRRSRRNEPSMCAKMVLLGINFFLGLFGLLIATVGMIGIVKSEQQDERLANCTIAHSGQPGSIGAAAGDEAGQTFVGAEEAQMSSPNEASVVIGAFLAVMAVLGGWGGWRANHRYLLLYVSGMLVVLAGMVHLAAFCAMAKGTAELYLRQYWCYIMLDLPSEYTENEFVQGVVGRLQTASALAGIAAGVVLTALWAASKTMGHAWTAASLMRVTNGAFCALGVLLVACAFVGRYYGYGGGAAVWVVGLAGAACAALSVLGFCGASRMHRRMLCLHFSLSLAVAAALFVGAGVAFDWRGGVDAWLRNNWERGINLRKVFVRNGEPTTTLNELLVSMHNHLVLVGLGAAIVGIMLAFNVVASGCFYRRLVLRDRRRRAEDEAEEEELIASVQQRVRRETRRGQRDLEMAPVGGRRGGGLDGGGVDDLDLELSDVEVDVLAET